MRTLPSGVIWISEGVLCSTHAINRGLDKEIVYFNAVPSGTMLLRNDRNILEELLEHRHEDGASRFRAAFLSRCSGCTKLLNSNLQKYMGSAAYVLDEIDIFRDLKINRYGRKHQVHIASESISHQHMLK